MPLAGIDTPSVVAAALIALTVGAGCALLLRGAVAGAGLLWFLIALLPVAQIVPYSEVVSEHNAYLPLAGLALAVGHGAGVAYRVAPRVAAFAIVCLVLALGVRSHDRAADWTDNLTLWHATVATAPQSVRGQFNLGIALLGEGQLLEARAALDSAHALAPDDRDVLLALATLHGRFGEYDRAREFADRALALRRDGRGLATLGWTQLAQGDSRGAIASFEAAIALGDGGEEAVRGLLRAQKRP
jgi:tetratricopeptide (TPR) repeat protein